MGDSFRGVIGDIIVLSKHNIVCLEPLLDSQ